LEHLGLPRTIDSLASIPPFCPTGVQLSDVHKTGLGSSAALITSLTAALLVHLDVISNASLSDDVGDGRRLVHNLAQFVHCVAQGKVGSGFDVSAAVFGSHLYTRFDPSVIQDLMEETLVCFICTLHYSSNYGTDFF
jgi:phosphomevalonate kinase